MIRRTIAAPLVFVALVGTAVAEPQKFARFLVDGEPVYGLVEGDRIYPLEGDLFGDWERTDKSHAVGEVQLLVPTEPRHVLAMAGNYESHIHDGMTTRIVTVTTTEYLIHDVASTVSFISRHVTLYPGDLIFTGTPGKTGAIKAGDELEVEIEGVGVLRNHVESEGGGD